MVKHVFKKEKPESLILVFKTLQLLFFCPNVQK